MGPVKFGLDGMTEWTYYGAASMGDGYDQLRNKEGCSYAYVDDAGRLLSTVTWEGVREGINDARYVAALRKLIERAQSSTSPEHQRLAREAGQQLESIIEELPRGGGNIIPEVGLDEIRTALADQIIALIRAGVPLQTDLID